ncbi:MAG: hypothetical protein HQK78_13890 [Desulfobacterales bacterium]|nr:hypothetical protein [Desulfobacterales bacterium]
MQESKLKKEYPITSVCKEDILNTFDESDNFHSIKKRVYEMDDSEMQDLAREMADDYTGQLFWESLRTIFEERFLNTKEA